MVQHLRRFYLPHQRGFSVSWVWEMKQSAITQRINSAKKYPYLDQMHPDDRVDYLAGKYRKKDKVRFLCDICGEYYMQSPKERQIGTGHRPCSRAQCGIDQRYGENYHSFNDLTPEYQEKCRNREITSQDRADFICPTCGTIHTSKLSSHQKGAGCLLCARKRNREKRTKKDYLFMNEIRLDYQEKIRKGEITSQVKVPFICPKHGEYWQTLNNHSKYGCPDCGETKKAVSARRKDYDFMAGIRPDYQEKIANGEISAWHKIPFICPKHGEYWQELNNHNKGSGCPLCRIGWSPYSLYEFLQSITSNIIVNDRQQIKPKEIDFYLPDYKIGFEFNDIYTHQTIWREQTRGNNILAGKPVKYHQDKHRACQEKGIRLFQIWDVEWQDERLRPVLESVIRNALGLNTRKIYARQCNLVESNSKECNPFFSDNHIQGRAKGKGYFALVHNDEIVGAICYTDNQRVLSESDAITISRMCFARDTTVVGGASRLLNAVIKKTKCNSIEYLVLNDYFDGVSFEKTGWNKISINPMVRYYDRESGQLYYRQIKRRNEFKQRCLNEKMYRYYTSGTTVYQKIVSPP